MPAFEEAVSFLPRLSATFEANIRNVAGVSPKRGWGQFIPAEAHRLQVGPYGTCAGLLVRSIDNPSNTIDQGIADYISSLWKERSESTSHYFRQNIRLAFLVLSLSRVSPAFHDIIAIRDAAVTELIGRQKVDGGWGDWNDDVEIPPSRVEPTAWCAFALSNLKGSSNEAARRAAEYLQKMVLAQPHIERSIDPFVLGVICRCLGIRATNRSIVSAASEVLRDLSQYDPLHITIYFFDYYVGKAQPKRVERDYLCVPSVFVACLLANALSELSTLTPAGLRTSIAQRKLLSLLGSITEKELFRPRQAKHAATVDQAFLALAASLLADVGKGWGRVRHLIVAMLSSISGKFPTAVVLPFCVLTLLIGLATNPQAVGDLWASIFGQADDGMRTMLLANVGLIQWVAALLLMFAGQTLVGPMAAWTKRFWASR